MPIPTLTYGCEIEMFQRGCPTDLVQRAIGIYQEAGLCAHDRLCDYHCDCSMCDYDRDGALLAAQRDSSVGAEFITRILSNRNNKDLSEMRKLRSAYADVLDATRFAPDGHVDCGNHVHVGWPNRTDALTQARVRSLLNGLWSAELPLWNTSIATGGAPQVRGYNSVPNASGVSWDGGWLGSNSGTVELRLWNTPLDPQRLLVHPALSVALIHWGLEVVDEEGDDAAFDRADTTASWARDRARSSRKRIAKIVRDIWPDARSAALAAELVAA